MRPLALVTARTVLLVAIAMLLILVILPAMVAAQAATIA